MTMMFCSALKTLMVPKVAGVFIRTRGENVAQTSYSPDRFHQKMIQRNMHNSSCLANSWSEPIFKNQLLWRCTVKKKQTI